MSIEEQIQALMAELRQRDGQSLARLNKRLGLAMSQMQRLLLIVGDDGLRWVEVRESEGRPCLWLRADVP